ncbi:hypothetical protein LP420_11805 [Massilia sp. B-10]|nr:hypothetical protein LP420_11805 [Massilia sp. B-10]
MLDGAALRHALVLEPPGTDGDDGQVRPRGHVHLHRCQQADDHQRVGADHAAGGGLVHLRQYPDRRGVRGARLHRAALRAALHRQAPPAPVRKPVAGRAADDHRRPARLAASLPIALESVANEGKPPVSQEFELLLREMRLGTDFGVALGNLERRVPLQDLAMVTA